VGEFSLIDKYFAARGRARPDVVLGIGDDAALLRCPPGQLLVVSIDTLVSGVHFPANTAAADVGYKALAVNLSDLAAMGAEPAWATLALTLPGEDEAWIAAFCDGFFELAESTGVALIGGDTTRGPLTVTIQVHGWVPPQQALLRSGARPGDLVYVSGTIGDAGLGLAHAQGRCNLDPGVASDCVRRLARPQPRLELGHALRGVASAAIDVSDGLSADLGHILRRSGVGALLELDSLPWSAAFRANAACAEGLVVQQVDGVPAAAAFSLCAGDDYELCVAVNPRNQDLLQDIAQRTGCPLTCIGRIEAQAGLRVRLPGGEVVPFLPRGYVHF
jgi:thiamine-monophosphate kinase